MKKNGKKARRLAKEKEVRRMIEEKRAGKPYSRVSKKRRLCTHYVTYGGGITVGVGYSYLYMISDLKCRCAVCQTEFSVDQYRAMEGFIKTYPSQWCTTVGYAHAQIQKIVPPVWYYQLDAHTVKTVPVEEGKVILPRITCIMP